MAIKKWTYDDGMLYHGDCLKVLKHLPEKSVDLVVGSPPYEQARLYLEDGKDLGIARDTEEWVAWMVEIFRASLRVCTGLVAFVVGHGAGAYAWSGAPALLCADLIRRGYNLRSPVWYKRYGIMGSGGKEWLRADVEWIVCATDGKMNLPWSDNTACGHPPKYGPGGAISHRNKDGSRSNAERYSDEDNAAIKKLTMEGLSRRAAAKKLGLPTKFGSAGHKDGDTLIVKKYTPPELSNPGNVIDCGAVGGGKMGSNVAHDNEAPFPAAVPAFFIKSFCKPGGTVLDPFSGSGTTVGEAVKLGRRFVGVDLRLSQIKLTQRRLKQARLNKGFGF